MSEGSGQALVETVEGLLERGLPALGMHPSPALLNGLTTFADELLRWNTRINLTAITEPLQFVDKHLLDSLAVLAELPPVDGQPRTVLDLGAGAGLPGIPWALARPDLVVTLVDAVAKKVAFMKAAIARGGLVGRAVAQHRRLAGDAHHEGLERAQVVVSRAFMDVEPWLQLARHYVAPRGLILAMVSHLPPPGVAERCGKLAGCQLVSARRFELPLSKDPRGVLVFSADP